MTPERLVLPDRSGDATSFILDANATVGECIVEKNSVAGILNQPSFSAAEGPGSPFVTTKAFKDCSHFTCGQFPTIAEHVRMVDFIRSSTTHKRFQFPHAQLQFQPCKPSLSIVKLSDKIGAGSGDVTKIQCHQYCNLF